MCVRLQVPISNLVPLQTHVVHMMLRGRNAGKKPLAVHKPKGMFDIMNLLTVGVTDANPLQLRVCVPACVYISACGQ